MTICKNLTDDQVRISEDLWLKLIKYNILRLRQLLNSLTQVEMTNLITESFVR